MKYKMGNHSDTGELLEEARILVLTEKNVVFGDTFIDEFGNAIKLDRSPEELANPTRLKDSAGRDVDFIMSESSIDMQLVLNDKAMVAKGKKKKTL